MENKYAREAAILSTHSGVIAVCVCLPCGYRKTAGILTRILFERSKIMNRPPGTTARLGKKISVIVVPTRVQGELLIAGFWMKSAVATVCNNDIYKSPVQISFFSRAAPPGPGVEAVVVCPETISTFTCKKYLRDLFEANLVSMVVFDEVQNYLQAGHGGFRPEMDEVANMGYRHGVPVRAYSGTYPKRLDASISYLSPFCHLFPGEPVKIIRPMEKGTTLAKSATIHAMEKVVVSQREGLFRSLCRNILDLFSVYQVGESAPPSLTPHTLKPLPTTFKPLPTTF